jgi:hypothetical protein
MPSNTQWTALSCAPHTAECWAGGGGAVTEGDPVTAVLAHFVGGQWSQAHVPLVVGQVNDVFCDLPSSCVAVGDAAAGTNAGAASLTTVPTPATSTNTVPLAFSVGSYAQAR